ncbi:MAG: M20/M25/M40 family metallo-hydrolase [Clostridia bacterium]|nr:M20/M25/M40 family metallo-hydrolase [Clostridia bacterium]
MDKSQSSSRNTEHDDWLNACKKVIPNLPMKVLTIHAGLECGYFIAKIPDMDIISVGPTLLDIHSPDEKLLIDTVEPFFKVLCEVLNQRK